MKVPLLFFVIIGITQCYAGWSGGYDWGGPDTACKLMKPMSKMKSMKDRDYYKLEASSKTFYPGQTLHFRIAGKKKTDRYSYTGLFLKFQKDVGSWKTFHMNKYMRLNCTVGSGLTEAHQDRKFVQDDVFVWTAPSSCDPAGEPLELRATVVMSDAEYLPGLKLKLKCIEKPPRPVLPEDACAANYHAPFPNVTSLENGYDGWWNSPEAPQRWTIHFGPTPSPKTGPSAAYDGEYYAYMEASYPAMEGDYAILNSPPGLSGCMCVRFRCHMWSGTGAYFEARANGKMLWKHEVSGDVWLEGYISLNDSYNPVAQVVAHRGADFRGDIAVDYFSYHAGTCPEDL